VRSTKTRDVHAESQSGWCSLRARHPLPISAGIFEGAIAGLRVRSTIPSKVVASFGPRISVTVRAIDRG